jgi:CRISPR-associated protein Csh1
LLDSVAKLGEELLKESPDLFLKSLVKYKEKSKGESTLLRIVFDVSKKKIRFDELNLSRSRCEEYWWIGNTFKASREHVLRLTSDKPEYLLRAGEGIEGMTSAIENSPENLRKKKSLKELYYYLKKIKENFKDLERFIDDIKAKADLYTVSIKFDGQVKDLAKMEGYREFLEAILLRVHETVKGTCYLCGSGSVLIDPGFPSGSLLKMYVLDKKGFLSGISDSEISKKRTFSLCPQCLKKLLTGMGYIEKNLRTSIGELNLYLIPRSSIKIRIIEKFLNFVKEKFDTVKSYENLKAFDEKLRSLSDSDYSEYSVNESSYTLNLIFGRREQASFSFYYEITEVPVSSLTSLANAFKYMTKKMGEVFGDEENLNVGFEEIYRIFPLSLRKTKGGLRLEGHSPLILLYSSLLHGHAYSEEELMKRALLFSRIHRYELYSAYNIPQAKNGDIETCYGIIKFNILLRLLEGGLSMQGQEGCEPKTSTEESISRYFELMGYEDWQKSLFLIGYLIGEIGRQQYLKGDEKKSILSKINFDGMGMDKVMVLSNQILESLRNYKILSYNEAIYAEMKKLLDNNLDKVNDPVKNVFYILSGYAFSTIKSIKAHKQGDTTK